MTEKLTVKKIIEGYNKKEFSVSEISGKYYKKIEEEDKKYNSFITLNSSFLKESEDSQAKYQANTNNLLEGVPIGVKDNILVKDILCTCASKILSNFVSPYNATVIDRLKSVGVNFIGKTNMDEFAMGSTTENSFYGATKNPVNVDYVPGGSSGGSASCVAAGFVPAALGSDTGGSVRQPASFCGIVGYKPSYGLLSRYGLVAYGSSLDQIGTLTNTCEDAAILVKYMKGVDRNDSTSSNINPLNIDDFKQIDLKNKKIGIIRETIGENTDKRISQLILETTKKFQKYGATVEEVTIPALEYSVSIYYIIAPAEASSNLARYDGIRYGLRTTKKDVDAKTIFTETRKDGFGEEVKKRILIGNFVLSSGYYDAYYKKAQKARILLSEQFRESFAKYDFLITPTSPVLPFKIGEGVNNPLALYVADLCTIPANLSGLPAVSIPVGKVDGLPVGMQIMAKRFDDGLLLGVGEFIQKNITDGDK
ncbi:MAG: glutaminyl-tRNA synthase (glutamine-hydrolyzing) subunit A [Spirochaetes bacterium GWC1_27_15]|nr:MAG: glutaminyl-tRNA synthase (glutamine-hydrolyzing) subunit A [Spirochaetes bacterium GWB1_27_13]OHD25765.1 MAG: glutaminyl-tRNA synthase (glutamine-hydrolyzing) subunit A [Spirochaetes bacterium GWC1_27_15]